MGRGESTISRIGIGRRRIAGRESSVRRAARSWRPCMTFGARRQRSGEGQGKECPPRVFVRKAARGTSSLGSGGDVTAWRHLYSGRARRSRVRRRLAWTARPSLLRDCSPSARRGTVRRRVADARALQIERVGSAFVVLGHTSRSASCRLLASNSPRCSLQTDSRGLG